MFTYEKIQEGVIDLSSMSTTNLLGLLDGQQDQRVRDAVGDELIYNRHRIKGRKRVLCSGHDANCNCDGSCLK